MKLIKVILLGLMIMMLSACGSGEADIEMNPLDPVERDETEAEDEDGYNEVEVIDNGAGETTSEETNAEVNETEEATSEETETEEVVEEDEEIEEAEVEEPEEEVLLDGGEYQVLDLSEIEDPNSYETGLVFIVQEGDIWRVVDRLGNVYRVSTSYEGLVQGIVNLNASVTVDEEDNAKVSLSRDYDKYSDVFAIDVYNTVADEFSTALLDNQKQAAGTSKIDSYTINSISSEKIGKGIIVISLNFDVVPSDGAISWGTNPEAYNNIDYTYTVYGYESTWLLPQKAPLFTNVVTASGNPDNDDRSDESETEEASDGEEASNEEDDSDDSLENSSFNGNELQRILADINGNIYYSEKELLPQSDALEGSDLYEHNIKIYEYNGATETSRQIVKGDKNGNYSLLKVYDNKLYLTVTSEGPSSGGALTGLSFINLGDLSYRSLYSGQVAKGTIVNDKAYVFTNDNLLEIDLENASLRIASNLPKHLEFDSNSVNVVSFENSLLTVEISYETEAVTYTIHVVSGETTVIDSFTF